MKNHTNLNKYLRFFATILFVIIGFEIQAQENPQCFPDTNWIKHDSIELIGYDSKKIDNVLEYVIDRMNTTGLVVVVDGKILFDYGDIEELSYIASCRKSVLSMMFGKYVENGTIDLDMTLDELNINDIQGLLPIERQATIRHLITARSGIYLPASNGGDGARYAPQRGSVKPGSYFVYNNWDFNAAGGIFEKLTNKDIYEAFEQDIAIPINMQDYKLEKQQKFGDSTKSNFLAYHFWLSTRDMARLGLLMLNIGNWNGKQVIPESWIKLSTSVVTPPKQINPSELRDGDFGFGYMWWIWCSENEILKDHIGPGEHMDNI
jgi:CubicO group peptidase (beta-lactamase class C family)